MDVPPVPKPRRAPPSLALPPTPLPRTNLPAADKVPAALLTSLGTKSKHFTDGVAAKITNSARGTLEKTKSTTRAVRDTVARSVMEGTRLLKPKKVDTVEIAERCTSMPDGNVVLFENISFNSPLQKQNDAIEGTSADMCSNLNNANYDDLSLFSVNSDSHTDSTSDLSLEMMMSLGLSQATYDTFRGSRTNSIASGMSLPEIPERKNKYDVNILKTRRNTSYENYILPVPGSPVKAAPEGKPRPSQSTIYEFDPLNSRTSAKRYQGVSNELLLLESYLTEDTYGTVLAGDSDEEVMGCEESDYYNPPSPPERFDSLSDQPQDSAPTAHSETHTNWFVTADNKDITNSDVEVKQANSLMQKFSRKLDNVLHKPARMSGSERNDVDRPSINKLPAPYFSGMIMRNIAPGLVEDLFKTSQSRFCVLSDQKLVCYSDPTNGVMKEVHPLNSIYCVQLVPPWSLCDASTYSFELHVAPGPRGTPRKHVFTCNNITERRNWTQKISEHLAAGFPPKYTAEYHRMGWCNLKEGVSGEWRGAWLMLVRRELLYCVADKEEALVTIDLRKTRCVATQVATTEAQQAFSSDDSRHLLLDCPHTTIYLKFTHEKLMKNWKHMIKLAAQTNGDYIHHQQLTKDDVPAIVDKCISFVYAYGSLSEGIYRRNGGSCTLGELLSRLRRDAWAVQLSPGQHSEHDVAGVLKRFLRDLPEPLIPTQHNKRLLTALVIDEESARFAEYRRVMSSLPLVARNTARKLFAHLHFLHSMSHTNKMTAENLASVWAPTIMPSPKTDNAHQAAWSSKEVFVVRDLITHYESIWESTESEKLREGAMRKILMRVLSNSAPSAPKAAGDLRAWIYVKDKSVCFQVALTPSKTSGDVCIELCEKANMESHMLMLEEVICDDSMRRLVHVDEVVLDVVLRWGYWDEEDRKTNYLVVRENSILHEIESLRNNTSLVCGELKIATESSKTFKLHMFEFQHSCLCYFKDKQGSHKIEEWNIKDILWYIGHEPKRNPQSRWALTFIPRNKQKRSKDKPWFGCTIAGAVNEDRLKWMTGMMFGEHNNILPSPRLVIT